MKKNYLTAASAISILLLASSPASFAEDDAFTTALTSGKASIDMRLRYEGVDQDGISDDANGLTLRTRLGYKTGAFLNTTAFVEFEDSRVVGGVDEYAPETAGHPVIADPESTELNQAYLSIKASESLNILAGRQRLILDNARFIGNVGWRQNEQTFDAITFKHKAGGFDTTVSWIDQVNGIIDAFDAETSHLLFNTSYKLEKAGKLTAYFYGLDNEDSNAESDTYGLRFAGKTVLNDRTKLIYTAEYAKQDTNSDKDADYTFVELGLGFTPVTVFAGYELLGSDDGGYGFQTALATKHAFNGWSDKFLKTPDDGLEDVYLKAVTKLWGAKIVAIYHDYSGDDSGDDFGSEFDLLIVKPIAKKYKIGLKYANYSEDGFASDTEKVWVWGEMKI